MSEKICQCGAKFTVTGNNHKRCKGCQYVNHTEKAIAYRSKRALGLEKHLYTVEDISWLK